MTQQDKEQLKLEIDHIFESGANEIRIFEMVVNFIDSRNGVNKNFVLTDVSHRLLRELRQTYLVNVDDDGQPKASIAEIMDLWDRVNRELQIVTID